MLKKIWIVFCVFMLTLSACGKNATPVDEYCWKQVSNYSIITENEDGTVTVILTAPDYAQLIQKMLSEDSNTEVSVETLAEATKTYPEVVKDYLISSSTADKADIQAAFSDQIAKELAIVAIGRAESIEEWGDGQ